MAVEGVDAWPLYWPEDWKRTDRFKRTGSRYEVNFVKAREDVLRSLKLMGATEKVISTNIPLRRDGLPLANMREPEDPGVAVYWVESKWEGGKRISVTRVMACDQWRTVRDNMRAVGLSLEALRAIKRAGATQVLDQAFKGFTALPAQTGRSWREVLGLVGIEHVTPTQVERVYREIAVVRHPDKPGGSNEKMVELNRAREDALREIGE